MISTYQHNRGLQKAKPFTLHCSLLLIVFVYAFLGGLVFNRLEAKALEKQKNEEYQAKLECVRVALEDARLHKGQNNTVLRIANCWTPEKDERSEWGYMTATLYGFGICTTLGYNRIAPVTTKGRLFCMLYGIIGIPMTMIIIANVGQYLREFAGNWRKKIEIYRVRRRESKMIDGDLKDVQDASIEYVSLALLLVFSAYIALGAWLLPLLNGQLEIDFINGLYYNFLCLTAMDFGQLAPQKVMFLPITFIYVCFGLAITTIAIEVGSEYMKKLHYLGQRVKSVATTKIWFGSKNLRVRDLLHAVGRKCGVDPDVIDGIDLENVEGREPPEDTNDVYPPQEPGPKAPDSPSSFFSEDPPDEPPPSPPKPTVTRSSTIDSRMFNIKTAVLRTVSNQTTSALGTFEPSMDKYNVVAIDVTSSSIDEQVINFEEPIVVGLPSEVVVTPETSLQAESSVPVVLLDKPKPEIRLFMEPEEPIKAVSPTPSVENTEPKNFEEKKQRYAKDAGKLLETYQEEWDRLARLSDEKYRRKSVLFPYSTGNHHSGGDASSTGSARSK
ncbi:hypothetical protein L596_020981 [Steinernema carpocapsae]|uniref:Potassium channel domain-containing protein n=1 Tax=Steinernema carpocapsae TaxID=34508 RepID=A0A4U5MV62_STECR|nr:hypothetical protein L596_020981 [Steinernema carpocapsae]